MTKMSVEKKKNAILVDFDVSDNWEFLDALETSTGEKWVVEKSISNRNHGGILQKLIRYAKYFLTPFKVFLHRNEYSRVLGWQQFYGLILAFYCHLFKVTNAPDITVMTFIYKPKHSLIGGRYRKFVHYCVTSPYIKQIIVFSDKEKKHYAELLGVPECKFVNVRLGIEDSTDRISAKNPERFYLAAGRSNRDYSFLLSVWDFEEPLKIVCDSLNEHSENTKVEILRNCHGDDYLNLLSHCYAVIIPLQDTNISSGQLVVLQAMMYGKPIIVTENDSVLDYIVDGEDGYIIRKDADELKCALEKVNQNYPYLSKCSREHFMNKFSLYQEGISIGNLIKMGTDHEKEHTGCRLQKRGNCDPLR